MAIHDLFLRGHQTSSGEEKPYTTFFLGWWSWSSSSQLGLPSPMPFRSTQPSFPLISSALAQGGVAQARCWPCCDSQEFEVSKRTPELSDLVMLLS